MKTIKYYTPVILQAIFLLIGFLLVNSLSAREAEPTNAIYYNINTVDVENVQELEDWMLDPSLWNCEEENGTKNLEYSNTSLDLDDEIQFESWMLDANDIFWSQDIELALSGEGDIILEGWMTDTKYWLN